MKQETDANNALELGSVSASTEGSNVFFEDSEGGMQPHLGLADD